MTERSRTTWSRLLPRPRDERMRASLRAEVADPLWMLSRQWQFDEFAGEDAGSPVSLEATVEHDPLTAVDLTPGADRPDSTGWLSYDGGPLETLAERERVMTAETPGTQAAAEAGLQFLRYLRHFGYDVDGRAPIPGDFPGVGGEPEEGPDLGLDTPEEPLSAPDQRFTRLVTDRALDGVAVFRALKAAVSGLGTDAPDWDGADTDGLPLPVDGTVTEAYREAAVAYHAWYLELYSEPTAETGSAWIPERLEYGLAVQTGHGEDATVFEASEYEGGALDHDDFSVGSLAAAPSSVTEDVQTIPETRIETIPTRVSFPGMPAARWWELEDTAVTLSELSTDGSSIPKLLLLDFAVSYGNDWFSVPVDVPVGSFSRVTELSVTDSFGITSQARPVGYTAGAAGSDNTDGWRLFHQKSSPNDRPGVFVPPTLSDTVESEPVERVSFARDEMANLAFAIESLVESPVGRAFDRGEFSRPRLVIKRVAPADDPDAEFVELSNPGEDTLDISGWHVIRGGADAPELLTFSTLVLEPEATLRVHTGASPPDDPTDDVVHRGLEEDAPLWTDAGAVTVTDASDRVVAARLLRRPDEALADYHLVGDVPDNWFPFVPDLPGDAGGEIPDSVAELLTYRLERGVLLDASTLGVDPEALPTPVGAILNPDPATLATGETNLRLYEEEVTRSGREVVRHYQYARWHDGSSHLWSGRRSSLGHGEVTSGLRFDTLEERRQG